MTKTTTTQIDEEQLLIGLDRLATGFESEDPILRSESKRIAKQNIRRESKKL